MPELGSKHTCVSCSTKFYDLNRSPIICPKCGDDQTTAPRKGGAKKKTATRAKPKAKKKASKPKKAAKVIDKDFLDPDLKDSTDAAPGVADDEAGSPAGGEEE